MNGPRARPPGVVRSRFEALGTYVELLVADRPSTLGIAVRLLRAELVALDEACSRFRSDSELARVNAAAGRPTTVTPLLAEAVAAALHAARQTDGDVDPTLGEALLAAGYDADFAALPPDGDAVIPRPPRSGAWRGIELDEATGVLRLPPGTVLDLGATAKALGSDRAAGRITAAVPEAGVLVNLGGDIAVAGPPFPAGWPVRVTDRPVSDDDGGSGQVVHLHGGGLATSSTAVRRWRRGGVRYHHILDPRTGLPVDPVWRTVTVTAASCVDANTASTAAIVRGAASPGWLADLGLPSRLMGWDGQVVRVAGWPGGPGGSDAPDPEPGRGGGVLARVRPEAVLR